MTTVTIGGLTFDIADFLLTGHAEILPETVGGGGQEYESEARFPNRVFNAFLYQLADLANALVGTSATSITVSSSGTITPTLSTGKGFAAGMRLRFTRSTDSNTWVEGELNSYNASTGASNFTKDDSNGSGSHSDWVVTMAGAPPMTAPTPNWSADTSPEMGGNGSGSGFEFQNVVFYNYGLKRATLTPAGSPEQTVTLNIGAAAFFDLQLVDDTTITLQDGQVAGGQVVTLYATQPAAGGAQLTFSGDIVYDNSAGAIVHSTTANKTTEITITKLAGSPPRFFVRVTGDHIG